MSPQWVMRCCAFRNCIACPIYLPRATATHRVLSQHALRILRPSFAGNKIKDKGAIALAKGLQTNYVLTSLDINGVYSFTV